MHNKIVFSNGYRKAYPRYYIEFLLDTLEDLQNLPTNKDKNGNEYICSIGSKAIILETKEEYILNNNSEWVFFKKINSDSGENSGNSSDTKYVVKRDDVVTRKEFRDYLGLELDPVEDQDTLPSSFDIATEEEVKKYLGL